MGKGWKPAKSTWGTRKESINQIISAHDKSLSENRELKYAMWFLNFFNTHIVVKFLEKATYKLCALLRS